MFLGLPDLGVSELRLRVIAGGFSYYLLENLEKNIQQILPYRGKCRDCVFFGFLGS